jgi:hypothetical protein
MKANRIKVRRGSPSEGAKCGGKVRAGGSWQMQPWASGNRTCSSEGVDDHDIRCLHEYFYFSYK